jgi:hypothetical protein
MPFAAPTNGPWGLQFGNQDCRVYNRTGGAISVGQVVQFELDNSEAEVSDNNTGTKTSGLSNVVAPADNQVVGKAILAVALDDFADDTAGDVRVFGRVPVLADGTISTLGSDLSVTSAKVFSETVSAGHGIWAISLEALSTGTPADVFFNGYGFANHPA